MTRNFFACCLLSLCAICALTPATQAQKPQARRQTIASERPKSNSTKDAGNGSYAAKMLELAEADAGSLEGAMRAFAQLQIARAYARSDKKKSLELLESSMTAARAIPDDSGGPTFEQDLIEEQILQEMIPLAPSRVDDLLSNVTPRARIRALRSLLSYYDKNNQQDRAFEMLYRISDESEMPYNLAVPMMEKMSPEQDAEFQRLFTASLASFRDHKHKTPTTSDLGAMVVRFWERLPKNAVREAIDEMLRQAEDADKEQTGMTFSVSSTKGAVSFASFYQWRLFQLLPVLKNIDESGADDLLKKNLQTAALLSRYPEGIQSVSGQQQQNAFFQSGKASAGGGGSTYAVRGNPTDLAARMEEIHRAQKIVADAAQHPQDALASVAIIQDAGTRCDALLGIARASIKKDSSVARSALSKFMDTVNKVDPVDRQTGFLRNAARLYTDLQDLDSARSAIERGITLASKLYSADNNADDPNKAFKFFWPSAVAYSTFLREAGKISPAFAISLLPQIGDPDMKAVAETALACEWSGVPSGAMITSIAKANETSTVIED